MTGVASSAEFEELQSAAVYKVLLDELRAGSIRRSILGTVVGALSVWMGAGATGSVPLGCTFVILGVSLIATSIWMMSALTPEGVIADGLAWLFLGASYIAAAFVSAGAGGWSVAMGLLMALGSWLSLRLYSPLSGLLDLRPPAEALDRLDRVVREVGQATMTTDPQIVQFRDGAAWKGWVGEVGGIFVGQRGWDVFFLKREDVTIEAEEGEVGEDSLTTTFRSGEYSFSGTISSESFRRYREWKHADPSQQTERSGSGTSASGG